MHLSLFKVQNITFAIEPAYLILASFKMSDLKSCLDAQAQFSRKHCQQTKNKWTRVGSKNVFLNKLVSQINYIIAWGWWTLSCADGAFGNNASVFNCFIKLIHGALHISNIFFRNIYRLDVLMAQDNVHHPHANS